MENGAALYEQFKELKERFAEVRAKRDVLRKQVSSLIDEAKTNVLKRKNLE